MADTIQFFIVDPSTRFRLMLRAVVDFMPGLSVASGMENGFELLQSLLEAQPDVIVMKSDLPMLDGLAALHHLMLRMPVPTIIIHENPKQALEIEADAYRFGAVAVLERPAKYLESESDWTMLLIETIEAAAAIKVSPLADSPVEERKETGEKYWSDRILFCEECGGKNILTPRQLAFAEPPCSLCGDPLFVAASTRYRSFRLLVSIVVSKTAVSALLHLAVLLPHAFPAAYVILVESEELDKIIDFLNQRSSLRVLRLRDRITVEGGVCYIGHVKEFVKFSNATNQPTLLVGSQHVAANTHPCTALFSTVATEMKSRAVAVLMGEADPFALAGQGAVDASGGSSMYFYMQDKQGNQLLPGVNRDDLEDMTSKILNVISDKLESSSLDKDVFPVDVP